LPLLIEQAFAHRRGLREINTSIDRGTGSAPRSPSNGRDVISPHCHASCRSKLMRGCGRRSPISRRFRPMA
jgi:hypothetical protein